GGAGVEGGGRGGGARGGRGPGGGPADQCGPDRDLLAAQVGARLAGPPRWHLGVRGEPVQALAEQVLHGPVHGRPPAASISVPSWVLLGGAGRSPGSCHGPASSRSRRSPRAAADLTVPSVQPSSAAVSASVRCSQ